MIRNGKLVVLALLAAGVLAAALAPLAGADHNVLQLVSIGPSGGNANDDAFYDGASADGTRVFFETPEQLVPADTDTFFDVYERYGSTTTLISTGPSGSNGADVFFDGNSADGTRVFFETDERLLPAVDTDNYFDIYERSGGVTSLVSTGPNGGNGNFDAFFDGSSADGTRVFFTTPESLLTADTDSTEDVYQRSGSTTTQISTGPNGGNANASADFRGASQDGTRVFFESAESLLTADTDSQIDVYERSGGTTAQVSTGPSGGNGAQPAFFDGSSADGTRVFFRTQEGLTALDTDGQQDVYQRSGGSTTLISTGPTGGNGSFVASYAGSSADGTRVFFHTQESLVGTDSDSQQDVYERTGGVTNLLSTGPTGGNGNQAAFFDGSSADGSRVFFATAESLVSADTDTAEDNYERTGGATTLLSGGTANDHATYDGASTDGTRVFFDTREALLGADGDTARDVYVARVGYAAPASATQVSASLVPIFRQCGTGATPPNGSHSGPLSVPSCLPPVAVGVAHFGNQAVATSQFTVVPGNLATPADEADVTIAANATDIRGGSPTGADYNPSPSGADATLSVRLRFTDLRNGASGDAAGTTTDLDFSAPVNCANTPSGTIGATCSASTSADAVTPGAIAEGNRSNVQVFRIRVIDSGANGTRGDGDDRLFAQQGFYVP